MAVPATLVCFAACLLCLQLSVFVQADYIFEVHVESYSNPTNQEAGGGCCDEVNGECEECEPYYNLVCLRSFAHSHADLSNCPLGLVTEDAFDIPSTVSITETEPWPGSFQAYIPVFDEDVNAGDDLLDRIFADRSSLAVSNEFSSIQGFLGVNGLVTLGLQFKVQCASGWEGDDCADCIPATGCSEGFCIRPDECICNFGWNGTLCDECIPAAGCSPVGGFCNQPRECQCNPDWDGPLCDQCTLTPECCSGQYECSNGECITGNSSTVECDGTNHCTDGSDEDCLTPTPEVDESSSGGDIDVTLVVTISGVIALLLLVLAFIIVCVILMCWFMK